MRLLVALLSQRWVKVVVLLIMYTPSGFVWQLISGCWVACVLVSSMMGIYVPLWHQLIVAFLMCLSGDQCVYLMPRRYDPTWYVMLVAMEFACAAVILIVLHMKAGSAQHDHICDVFVDVVKYFGVCFEVRVMYKIPVTAIGMNLDQRVLLAVTILLMMWVQFVEWATRYVTNRRAAGVLVQKRLILGQAFCGAVCYSLNQEHAVISHVFGRYPWEYATFMLLPAYILMYFFWALND